MINKGLLERMQFAAPRQSLNCYDRVAFEAHGERQAGVDPLAVDVDRAGPALAEIAALLRPRRNGRRSRWTGDSAATMRLYAPVTDRGVQTGHR
jgi:hypothetical protein